MTLLPQILDHNARFVKERRPPRPRTSKPEKQLAIFTCMDTRLVEFLEPALGIQRGDAKIIKNAGATLTESDGAVVRGLMVAVYALGCREILVIGHRDCGMAKLDDTTLREAMAARGISADALGEVEPALDTWLGGFSDPEANVAEVATQLRDNPLLPSDVPIHGLIFDPNSGQLDLVSRDPRFSD